MYPAIMWISDPKLYKYALQQKEIIEKLAKIRLVAIIYNGKEDLDGGTRLEEL